MLIGRPLGLQTLSVFLLQSFWVLKQSADLLLDRSISLVHAQLLVPTYALEALTWNIHGSPAAIIRITLIVGATTISIATLRTEKPALQYVAGAFLRNAGSPPV